MEEREVEHLRYLRRRVTRTGNAMIDRRDAFCRIYGFSPTPHRAHRGFGRSLEKGLSENDESLRTLEERWRFDEDDNPIVAPEGIDEQDRVLIDDFSPDYLRHMMTLLSETDQQHVNNDATLVLVSTEGRQQSVLPFRTGAQQPYIRRDAQTARAFSNGISQLASRQLTSVPISAVPNGVPIAMQTHVKSLQPQSTTPRISHSASLRPPGPPQMMNMIPAVPLSQTPPPHVTALPVVPANGRIASSLSPAPPPSDADSLKLASAPATKGATVNGANQHVPDPAPSPASESQQSSLPTGSPVRQKADVHQPVSIPLNGYHIPINGYTIPNTAYIHSRPPNGLTVQQMQNLKFALTQGQDLNAAIHGTQGRPIQTSYVGHLVPNGTHYNMQIAAGANLNMKLASGRQWNGVAPPLQQNPSLGNQQQDPNSVPGAGSPNLTAAGVLPARTPSANGTRSVNRPGGMGSSVGHMMSGGQYAAHSVSPRLQNAGPSPLPNPTSLPPHQSPPRQSLTPTMKMASPSLQHQAVPSSQGGY